MKINVSYIQKRDNGDREFCQNVVETNGELNTETVFALVCALPGRLGWTPVTEGLTWQNVFSL